VGLSSLRLGAVTVEQPLEGGSPHSLAQVVLTALTPPMCLSALKVGFADGLSLSG